MISKEMAKALNAQVNKEIFSAYFYQSMSAYAAYEGLKGIANWFDVQAQEELFHARKFYNYILDQGEKVTLEAIEQPEVDFSSTLELFEKTLEHERLVTSYINKLAGLAQKESDYATFSFLQWFITEQVEEEATASDLLGQVKLAGENVSGLFMIDKELQARTFTPPAGE